MKNLLLLTCTLILLSCGEETSDVSLDPGYDYLPLQIGQYRDYEVEEINIVAFEPDTLRYFLREVYEDSLVSADGSVKYLASRYKSNDAVNWSLDSVWSARRSQVVGVVTENDIAYCKLVFPVIVGKTWDGNSFNINPSQEYYFEPHLGYQHGGLKISPDSIVTVVIEDIPENLVNQDERMEVYARGIGLVEKQYTQLVFCTLNCTEKGSALGEIEKGRVLSQKLIAYGQE